MSNILKSCGVLLVVLLLLSVNRTVGQNHPVKPNVIIILADDMGYSDPACFGGELQTPALDKLAGEGIRLAQFRNSAMCVCSRASLLTGNYWPKAIPKFEKTELLPEKLKKEGYRTALIGKWHLKGDPMDRGFDHFFGFLGGYADHFAGSKDYRLDREVFNSFGKDYYSTDAFTDRAIEFIKSPGKEQGSQPFFLYLSFQAPHNPLQAPKEDIQTHRGKYLAGWQAIREARFKRQKEMGIVAPTATLPDCPENLPDWNELSPEQRDLEDLRMSVYAAMIERMDQGIGRVMDALRECNELDNTIILFASDNGTDSFSVMDAPFLKRGKLPGDPASNFQPGTGWAYAAVTPWRLYKISQHGGGVTTGGIVWFPAYTRNPGQIEQGQVHFIDVMPTITELLELQTGSTVEGESFLPLIQGKSWERKKPLYFQFMDNRAIRTHEWTLAEVDGAGWELFNLVTDPFENHNLAEKNTELVSKLQQQWQTWWTNESGKKAYQPESTKNSPHYSPQGDRGTGVPYQPSAMPSQLKDIYPIN